MPGFVQSGPDLAAFVRQSYKDAEAASEQAVRMVANRAAKALRQQIRQRFGEAWRVYAAPGFDKAIKVRHPGKGFYQVFSKAIYRQGRTQPVDLLWVFDQGPIVVSGFGKGGVAIPIPGETPISASGRRYAWPSELAARGWELEIVAIFGRATKLILGRPNTTEPFRPLYYWKPSVQEPKRLNLDETQAQFAATTDEVWGDIVDGKIAKGAADLRD